MTPPPYFVIRLKPKADARAIRHGASWVYSDDIVTDRRTRAIEPGTIAVLEDSGRNPLALVAANPGSRIMARILDRNPDTVINGDWIAQRVARAAAHRARLFDTLFYRLIHAEADGMPGLVVDRFGDVAVVQPNAAWIDARLDLLTQALLDITGVRTVLKNATGRARVAEGLDNENAILHGAPPSEPIKVIMNNATYLADLVDGQKTGLFYDQRPNHAFAQSLANGAQVLDVFSHVGGFSLAALTGGAKSALAVDSSAVALDLALQGAKAGRVADRFCTRRGDAFEVMAELAQEGARFDLVICDPPAFAPSKPALEKGLRAYERVARMAAPLVAEGGYLGLCSCSHAATLPKFRAASIRGIGRAGREAMLIHTGQAGPDHPMHLHLAESGYLKALFFRL